MYTVNDYMKVFIAHNITVYNISVKNGSMCANTSKGTCHALTPKLLEMLYEK